jgi:hypothetical protein
MESRWRINIGDRNQKIKALGLAFWTKGVTTAVPPAKLKKLRKV